MATIIDGRQLAKKINEQTAKRVLSLKARGITPGIAVILVGDDPASLIYTRNKDRKAKKLGMNSSLKRFPADVSQAEVAAAIQQLNADSTVHAILVQSPLPPQLDEKAIVSMIDPKKDVDGFHPLNVGRLYAGLPGNYPIACTPRGIMTMLHEYGVSISGANAVVMGRSHLVGRPIMAMLNNANATVTMLNSHTVNTSQYTRQADILVVAVGKANLIKADDVKAGATVIDVGINRDRNGKLVGDVDFDSVSQVAGKITPVPGGVGPMTIATLMQQTVDLAEWSMS